MQPALAAAATFAFGAEVCQGSNTTGLAGSLIALPSSETWVGSYDGEGHAILWTHQHKALGAIGSQVVAMRSGRRACS